MLISLLLFFFTYLAAIQGKIPFFLAFQRPDDTHTSRLMIVVLVQVLVMSLLAPVFCDNKWFIFSILNNISNVLLIFTLIYFSFFSKVKIELNFYIFKYSLIIVLPLVLHVLVYCTGLIGIVNPEPLTDKVITYTFFIIIIIAAASEYLSSLLKKTWYNRLFIFVLINIVKSTAGLSSWTENLNSMFVTHLNPEDIQGVKDVLKELTVKINKGTVSMYNYYNKLIVLDAKAMNESGVALAITQNNIRSICIDLHARYDVVTNSVTAKRSMINDLKADPNVAHAFKNSIVITSYTQERIDQVRARLNLPFI